MPIPLSVEEVVLWVCDYPSCVEVIVVEFDFVPYPSCVEVIVVLALCLASCVEVVVGERSSVLLTLYLQILRWRFPVWEVLCRHNENPSV